MDGVGKLSYPIGCLCGKKITQVYILKFILCDQANNTGFFSLFFCCLKLLAMIGEQFDHGDEICGAVVNVRSRQDKIAIWTKNASNEAAQVTFLFIQLVLVCFFFSLCLLLCCRWEGVREIYLASSIML